MVKLIKEDDPQCITLSIGDGANDVPMIQEAHIGIGLYGNEGTRAAQTSDYALGQFRYLQRLLFWHGRLSYLRNTELVLYFFYKNLVFTLIQAWFAVQSGYSGQTIYDDWNISLFNMIFTSLPLLAKALFDQDTSERNEDLYFFGPLRLLFNRK